jgi:hypothetical protein
MTVDASVKVNSSPPILKKGLMLSVSASEFRSLASPAFVATDRLVCPALTARMPVACRVVRGTFRGQANLRRFTRSLGMRFGHSLFTQYLADPIVSNRQQARVRFSASGRKCPLSSDQRPKHTAYASQCMFSRLERDVVRLKVVGAFAALGWRSQNVQYHGVMCANVVNILVNMCYTWRHRGRAGGNGL